MNLQILDLSMTFSDTTADFLMSWCDHFLFFEILCWHHTNTYPRLHILPCTSMYTRTPYTTTTTSILRPFFRDHPGEPVPEENVWTLWCKGRFTDADTLTIRLGATPSGLTSAHLHHPPYFCGPDALPAAQPTVSKHWRQLTWTPYQLAIYLICNQSFKTFCPLLIACCPLYSINLILLSTSMLVYSISNPWLFSKIHVLDPPFTTLTVWNVPILRLTGLLSSLGL